MFFFFDKTNVVTEVSKISLSLRRADTLDTDSPYRRTRTFIGY